MIICILGNLWEPYRHCRKNNATKRACLHVMERFCKVARHRVTKILRLSVDNLENILVRNPNIKVIHLFRDPRAVINSRLTTDWYYLKDNTNDTDFKAIRRNADGLCRRMTHDLKTGLKLRSKFPKRFAFLLYEDIYSNLQNKASHLYRYIGMTEPDKNDKYLNLSDIGKYEHTVVKRSSDFSSWWRTHLSFGAAKAVEDVCSNVFNLFNYVKFPSEKAMRDLTASSWRMHPLFETKYLENWDSTSWLYAELIYYLDAIK